MPEFPISGYHGRVLIADLSRGEVRTVPLDPALALDYLGGRGMATRVLYDTIDPACDPLGPENAFVIAASPLIAWLFLGEQMNAPMALGIVLITAGFIAVQRARL